MEFMRNNFFLTNVFNIQLYDTILFYSQCIISWFNWTPSAPKIIQENHTKKKLYILYEKDEKRNN